MSQKIRFVIFSFIIGGILTESLYVLSNRKVEINSLIFIIPTYFILIWWAKWQEIKVSNTKKMNDTDIIDDKV